MFDEKAVTPTADEIEYMSVRGLWDAFQQTWTPAQRALYLGQLREHYNLPLSARATALGLTEAEARRELQGLWGVLLWDASQPDPVPIHRD